MYLRKLFGPLLILISILVPPAYAQNLHIIDMYSDIDSADITIHSDGQYSNIAIDAELILDGKVLRSEHFSIDEIGPNADLTKILFWDLNIPPKGSYRTRMTLSQDDAVLETRYYNFSYGSPTIPRIFIKDIVPDSSGISVILAPRTSQLEAEPVLVDVVYMLLDDDTVIYRTTDRRITVSQATPISKNWNVRLENNHLYSARVKAKISSPREAVIAESKDFTAMDDARITELFRDETGASVTVLGMSQVPFTGDIVFTVSREGETIEDIKETSPILMSEDDETIEVTWNRRLPAGLYDLSIRAMGNDGDVVDTWDTIIEAEERGFDTQSATPAPTQTPGLTLVTAITVISLLVIWRKFRNG